MYLEARGESDEGQAAIIFVIIQRARLNKSYWGRTKIANVCKHRNKKGMWLFSCWEKPKPIDENSASYKNVEKVVNGVLYNEEYKQHDDGSDHYMNPEKVSEKEQEFFKTRCDFKKRIGKHEFYQYKNLL